MRTPGGAYVADICVDSLGSIYRQEKPLPSTEALIFDLDGVLVLSEKLHLENWAQVFAAFGVDFPKDKLNALQGLRGEQVEEWITENLGPSVLAGIDWRAVIDEKRRLFIAEAIPKLEAVGHAEAWLRKNKGTYPLALVTSARLKSVGQVLKHFGWRNVFEVLVAAEHAARSKPHPDPFLMAASRMKVEPAKCLVFEDSRVGIQAAKSAGMKICGLATTLKPNELKAAGAQWVIRDFSDEATLAPALAGELPKPSFASRLGFWRR